MGFSNSFNLRPKDEGSNDEDVEKEVSVTDEKQFVEESYVFFFFFSN